MEQSVHETISSAPEAEPFNGAPHNSELQQDSANATLSPNAEATDSPGKDSGGASRGEKNKANPSKVYIGGLPEHTRQEDLQNCFGKIGAILKIELKLGYGFVEFDTPTAAEESVAKYNEGFFMGNKIKVEISKGGSAIRGKYAAEPGACFKCGLMGHWARECPNTTAGANGRRDSHEPPLIDRIQAPNRDYPPPRDYTGYRDEYRYPPPARDTRYGYDYPPPPVRDYRRPPSPSRDYRDYPPPPRASRDYDDYRMRGGPPPVPPPRSDRPYYPEAGGPPAGYLRDYPPPPARDPYDRYDKRALPDRYPTAGRPRTPPGGGPPREYDRAPARDYPPDFRGRPLTPPPAARYAEYPPRGSGPDAPVRYRRRSQSPPRPAAPPYDSGSYAPPGGAYGGPPGTYAAPGYAGGAGALPPSGSTRTAIARDYPPPPPVARNGR